jgi:Family of unknown function (DUF6165)
MFMSTVDWDRPAPIQEEQAMIATTITVEISPGELLDKISILEIKNDRISEPAKLMNVRLELQALITIRDKELPTSDQLTQLALELRQVNEALWEIEDELRLCDRKGDFGLRFIELARSVYRNNDRRSAIKRKINELLGSRLMEEKSYES